MERDFVIGGLLGVETPQAESLQTAQRTREQLARRHRRRAQVDVAALVRDVLTALRVPGSPGERALLLVHVLGWLPPEPAGQLAQAVTSRLTPVELRHVGRAGLLALADAAAHLAPAWREAVLDLLAPALEARPADTRQLMGDVLVCAEGTRPGVARAVLRLRGKLREPSVLIVAATDDAAVTLDDWVSLLSAEAKLTGDAQLARFAALAQHGQVKVVSEQALPAPASRVAQGLAYAWAWVKALAYDEELPAPRRARHPLRTAS